MKKIFDQIVENKIQEVAKKRKSDGATQLYKRANGVLLENQYKKHDIFFSALHSPKLGDVSIVGEIKLKSPSTGILGKADHTVEKAIKYQQSYVEAVSVVTDEKYFGGSLELFQKVRNSIKLPMLMKDFVIDDYQIYEALSIRAGAILLIAKLQKYYDQNFMDTLAISNLEYIVEISQEEELELPLVKFAKIIGVNSRNLDTFDVDIEKACYIMEKIPKDKLIIGFSGIQSRKEVEMYKNAGARAVLVGTSLMKEKDSHDLIRSLKGLPDYG